MGNSLELMIVIRRRKFTSGPRTVGWENKDRKNRVKEESNDGLTSWKAESWKKLWQKNSSAFVKGLTALRCVCVGLGGLGVTWSPRGPRFVGSNPTEVYGFFQDVKILSTSPPGGTKGPESEISGSLKNFNPEKIGFWAKFNRHIHFLIPKIRGSTIDLKRSPCIGQQWPPHKKKTNTNTK